METRVCPIPSSLVSYTSAPSSPNRSTSTTLNACFFSVPTSPSRSRSLSRNPSCHEPDSITPCSGDFGFRSLEFPRVCCGDGYRQDMLVMAYADELFCEGKMLPLKLPPRLQFKGGSAHRRLIGGNGSRIVSSTSSSPGSRSLRLKMPFRRKTLWNDKFDPFVIALEKVKETDIRHQHQHNYRPRRSRSLSPLKWGLGLQRSKSMGPDGPTQLRRLNGSGPVKVEMGLGEQIKPMAEARRRRIKRFLLKSASFGWKTTTKEECRTSLLQNPHESKGAMKAAKEKNAAVKISRGIKSLVKHRSGLFCRTFGLRCIPKMN